MKKGKEAADSRIAELKEKVKAQEDVNKTLVENFTQLQRVMTSLSFKFDKLSDNMTKLLTLFELSARSFMSNSNIADAEKDKDFLEKLNLLLDQNKTIAKGLTLMEERFRERVYGQKPESSPQTPQTPPNSQVPQPNIRKLPRF